MIFSAKQGIWKYERQLPAVSDDNQISLGEGGTPLLRSVKLGRELGLDNLYFKLESLNPTGSYKDRISALGVSLARENGREACTGTTSGNAGGSIAAYAARAGLAYNVYVQENILSSKLEPMVVHQASVTKIEGFGYSPEVGNRVFAKVLDNALRRNWEVLVTAYAFAPLAMEGVKTIAYEIAEDLTEGADAIFVPVGGGGLLTGIYRGCSDLLATGHIDRLPKLAACQSTGCSNVSAAWKLGLDKPVDGSSTSLISGIQVPNPPDGIQALQALNHSGGFAEAVRDEDTWHWQEQLAVKEGILCEPAGAISLAGAVQALKEGRIDKNSKVICVVSGAGYKDSDRLKELVKQALPIPAMGIDEL